MSRPADRVRAATAPAAPAPTGPVPTGPAPTGSVPTAAVPTAPQRTVDLPEAPALGSLYRSALTAAGRGAVVGRLGPRDGAARRGPVALPDVAYAVRGVRADADRLTAYQHLLGEPGTDALPAGFVHVLAFPVATALMVRDDFPLPLLGLVHLANRVEQRTELRLGDVLQVRAWACGLRAHGSGTQVDLVTEVGTDGGIAWRGVSTYLAKGVRLDARGHDADDADDDDRARHSRDAGGGPRPSRDADEAARSTDDQDRPSPAPERPPFEPPAPTASWRLPADTGRRYAAVSGDVNPIHLWAPAARAFGFHGAIAHGMYTAARALATVGAARGESFTWSVEFAAPVVLPATVAVRVAADGLGAGHRLTLWDPRRGRPHLTGSVTPS